MADTPTLVSTGVPNLDRLLGGGIMRGALALVLGVPGAGKTTLVTQTAFAAARAGHTALIMTVLAEPVSKLINHLRQFAFFDPELVGGPIQLHSLEHLLPAGLDATGDQILAAVRQIKADLIVLDGFRSMRGAAADPQAASHFLYTLGSTLGALGVTTLVTAAATPTEHQHFPETTTADVIINLHYRLDGGRHHRGLEVVKVRGAAQLPGLHALTLDREGVRVYPQLEERIAAEMLGSNAQTVGAVPYSAGEGGAAAPTGAGNGFPTPETGEVEMGEVEMGEVETGAAVDATPTRATFALPPLDTLLHGGLVRETSTLLVGSLGVGKTLLALHFALEGVRTGEPVVYASFRETGTQLLRATEPFAIGPELRHALRPGGGLHVLHLLAIKLQPDVVADHLLSVLDQTHARRLVIDSISEIEDTLTDASMGSSGGGMGRGGGLAQRHKSYLAALVSAVQARGITTLYIKETAKAVSTTLELATEPVAILAENVLLLQQLALGNAVRRVVSVVKTRYSAHDLTVHEFLIRSPEGITVLGPLAEDEQRTVNREQHRQQRRSAAST